MMLHESLIFNKFLVKLKIHFAFSLFLIPFLSIFAQNDSLIQHHRDIIAHAKTDTTVIKSLVELGNSYFPQNPDSVYAMGEAALSKSSPISYCYGMINGYSLQGMSLLAKNQIPESRPYYIKAEAEAAKCDFLYEQAMFLRILGNIDFVASDYSSALDFWQTGIEVAEEAEYYEAKVEMLSNIGTLYRHINQLEKSEEFYLKAFEESEAHEIIEFYPNSLLNLSDLAMMKKQYVESKDHARLIVMSVDSINKSRNISPLAYENLANASLHLKQPDSALIFFQKMEESLAKTDPYYNGPDVMLETRIQLGLGKSYLGLGDKTNGKSALSKAFALSVENDLYDVIQEASERLSSLEEEEGNYDKALQYYSSFKSASDTLINKENLKELAIKETEYRFEEKERTQRLELEKSREKQQAQQIAIVSLVILGILIIAIILLVYRLQVLKSRKVKLENEKLEVDLKYKNRELAASVLQMMKKNELLMHIVPRLKKVALSSPKSLNGELNSVIKDIEFDSKEIGWNEFELRFKEVHSEYYEKLTEEFPNLTKNEQRLCAFLKLKMTTKEISSITFQSEHSINVARSRMKKKMGITDNKRLLQYLSQL